MKHLLITLAAFFALSGALKAQEVGVVDRVVIADTVVIVEGAVLDSAGYDYSRAKSLEDKWDEIDTSVKGNSKSFSNGRGFNFGNFGMKGGDFVAVVAIVSVFGMPVFIILIIMLFRYSNKRAKYRLVEKALESGQELPEGLFSKNEGADLRTKGIKNTFLGLGLAIFLWAITGEFGVACVGVMIMCIGIGEIVIYVTQNKDNNRNNQR